MLTHCLLSISAFQIFSPIAMVEYHVFLAMLACLNEPLASYLSLTFSFLAYIILFVIFPCFLDYFKNWCVGDRVLIKPFVRLCQSPLIWLWWCFIFTIFPVIMILPVYNFCLVFRSTWVIRWNAFNNPWGHRIVKKSFSGAIIQPLTNHKYWYHCAVFIL